MQRRYMATTLAIERKKAEDMISWGKKQQSAQQQGMCKPYGLVAEKKEFIDHDKNIPC